MQELDKIRRVIAQADSRRAARSAAGSRRHRRPKRHQPGPGFTEAVQCTGIVLAKLDGTAKGGVVIPIRQQFGLPVKFVGVGEKAEDLALFNPETFVEALFTGLTEETAGT